MVCSDAYEKKSWVYGGLLVGIVLIARRSLVLRLIYRFLVLASPILLLSALGMTALVYNSLRPKGPQVIVVTFDPSQDKLFSSWDDPFLQKISKGQIWVFGAEQNAQRTRNWLGDGYTVGFSFQADAILDPKHAEASSGGFLTFYDTPVDSREYRQLLFSARIENLESGAVPDIGVRLCVDSSNDHHEVAVYEVASLLERRSKRLNQDWQSYSFDLSEFLGNSHYAPAPDVHTNRYTINKVAFFVSPRNVVHCRRGTVWLRDIKFEPQPRH